MIGDEKTNDSKSSTKKYQTNVWSFLFPNIAKRFGWNFFAPYGHIYICKVATSM